MHPSSQRHGTQRRPSARPLTEVLETRQLLAAVAAVTPYNGQQNVAPMSTLSVTFGEAMNASTLTAERVSLRDPGGAIVPATLAYNATSRVLTIDPTPTLAAGSGYYTVRVTGGTNGVKAADGSALGGDVTTAFTCGAPNLGFQTVITGLDRPTNVEFAADGRVYVAEQSGVIKLYDNLSDST
ncbi:MAG TPA: Ig-like domain-containing protein, partial [Tepidisphaeraceae bacterium]